MFRGDILVLELVRFFECLLEHVVERPAHVLLSKALYFGQTRDFAVNFLSQGFCVNA